MFNSNEVAALQNWLISSGTSCVPQIIDNRAVYRVPGRLQIFQLALPSNYRLLAFRDLSKFTGYFGKVLGIFTIKKKLFAAFRNPPKKNCPLFLQRWITAPLLYLPKNFLPHFWVGDKSNLLKPGKKLRSPTAQLDPKQIFVPLNLRSWI